MQGKQTLCERSRLQPPGDGVEHKSSIHTRDTEKG